MVNNSEVKHTHSNSLIQIPIPPPALSGGGTDSVAPTTNTVAVAIDANDYKAAAELAYPLAIESYKEAERRMDVVEKRLQDLLAFTAAVTLGLIAACANKVNMQTWQFGLPMVFCITGFVVGVSARLSGRLNLISIGSLYNNYMAKSEVEFKMAVISWSGEDNKINAKAIRNKAKLTNLAAALFLTELAFLGAWVGRGGLSEARLQAAPNPVRAAGAVRASGLPGVH